MACKLQPVKGQSGVYTAESELDLKNFIFDSFSEAIMNADGGMHAGKLKKELKRALNKIGSTYNDKRLIGVVARFVQEISLDEAFLGMDAFFPRAGIYNTLLQATDLDSNEVTQAQYEESETSKEELKLMKSQFLDNFLGNKARLKNQLKQDVTHKLLNTFIVNREEGKLITNIGEANRMARDYKQLLFDLVMSYFKKARPAEYNMTSTLLYDGDKYTGVIQDAKSLTRYLDELTPDRLQAMHDSNPEQYEAAVAWFTLKNFDSFVNLLLGDIIDVHPNHKNTFRDGDGYQFATKGHHVITTWRKESDEYHLDTEIGALTLSLINSVPFYNFGISNKSNKFIKFEDFYRMITKMKDLALDPKSREIIINRRRYSYLFGENSDLSLEEQALIENQSLRSIINNIRINPQIYTRLAMRILIQGNHMDTLGYNLEEKNKTYSIYKGIFSTDKDSLYQILNQGIYDHNVPNYYSLITQVADSLFTVNFLQYNEDEGIITVRTLKDQGSDNIRRRIESGILGFNSRKIIGTDFETLQMEPYNMSPITNETSGKFEGITFNIAFEDDLLTDKNYDLTIALSDLGRTLTIYDADGRILPNKDLETILRSSEFLKFIDDLLNLGLTNDLDFIEAIETVYTGLGKAAAVRDLLMLASTVYMNKYVSNMLLKDKVGRKSTLKAVNAIFNDSELAPGYNSNLGEISLIPLRLIPVLNRIAEAKSITTGEAQSSQVRDAEGNMLSSQTLSRLLGSLQSQWERIRRSPDNAANGFSLIQSNIFKGCYTSKEYKAMMGNKAHTQFTVAESIQGNFLYDFVGGFYSVDNTSGKKIIGNGVIGLLPSVNSDKNTIGRMLLDLSLECGVDIPSIRALGRNKTWAELTINELQQVIAKELGDYYNKAYENIVKDYQHLQNWLAQHKSINVVINPETDFRELNEYCEELGKQEADILLTKWLAEQSNQVTLEQISKLYEVFLKKSAKKTVDKLYEWTREYNNLHPDAPMRFIEQTHFIKSGNGIKFNNTFNALRRRYADPKKLAEFFDLKRTELLKSLADEDVQIDLFSEATDKLTPKGWLREQFPDWVHKSELVKNGKMVLAKLTYNGQTYNITSKSDLRDFNEIVSTSIGESVDFVKNPHKLLNPKYQIQLELHPMLDKYNTMDYLFTLEFMIAGVGSHINHPGKTQNKTDIIWAHPGIGKTYTLENSEYKHQIMDWDVEFNHRRDLWIAKQTGTEKGTPEFKVARNEYLINWKNHADFQEFVKKEWERIKTLANSLNKILVASPHMLLQMFKDDFNLVLTMEADDFVERGLARGDSNPALWKQGIDNTINSLAELDPGFKNKITTIGKGEYLIDILERRPDASEVGAVTTFSTAQQGRTLAASYAIRTSDNASWSDITIAFATDFTTKGETLTAQQAGAKDKRFLGDRDPKSGSIDKYIPVQLTNNNDPNVIADNIIKWINAKGLPKLNIKLNIAGNGIYSFGPGITLESLDILLTEVLSNLQAKGITFSTVRSGGQTGIDEAGIKAAQNLGIPSHVHTTYDWNFRNRQNADATRVITDAGARQLAFIARFHNPKATVNSKSAVLYNSLMLLRENEMQEEAARFLAQHKRNVSYTAAMHEFLLGSIRGIPTEYNMAVIDDITAPVYTISGDRGDHAPFDGATFVNPLVVIWENNSLEESKAGIDKKQFIHYYDEATGTGGIVKTAGFGLTNDRVRRYKFYRDMIHNMLNRKWTNPDGSLHIMRDGGILKDFNGKDVNYGPIYFSKDGRFYMRELKSYIGNNTYSVSTTEVDEGGNAIDDSVSESIKVESNYDVWGMFGGHNSMELKNNKLVYSEKSIALTAKAANDYGYFKEGRTYAYSADDIVQPMKMSDIHYMPTVGAIKQGACNINPNSCYYGKHTLNFMKVKMTQAGIQLDKEHHADNSELSLMTLVLSAACANGYNEGAAKRLYNAIYSLSKAGTQEFRNELGEVVVGDSEKFNLAVTGIIMKAMINSTSSDGDLVLAIAQDLLKEMRTSKDFSFSPEFYKKAQKIIPNSDPTIYPKIVNMLTVALTKSGIKTKMPGILAVLCPSHEIIKFYKIPIVDENSSIIGYKRGTLDKLEQAFGEDLDAALEKLQSLEDPIQGLADVEMGYKYLITTANGTEVVHVNRIHGKRQNEGTRILNGEEISYSEISYEELKQLNPSSIIEWVKEGLDLKSYNVRFEGEDGVRYQLADLDIVGEYFKLKDLKNEDDQIKLAASYLTKYGKWQEFIERVNSDLTRGYEAEGRVKLFLEALNTKDISTILNYCNGDVVLGKQFKNYINRRLIHFMNRQMLISLNGISPSSDSITVNVNGKPVNVKKDTIKISSYGLVMPKTFKTNLGLDEFDDLEDIKNDPLFFVNKLADKFGTKVESYEDEDGNLINNFHLELKKSNGNHIYIRKGLTGSDLVKQVEIITRTDEDGNVFRVDGDGKVMYQLHSADDKVYHDLEGNEIIVTSGDKVTWTDMDDNEIDVTGMEISGSPGGIWTDLKTGNQIKRKFDSGLQFYLDTMDYNSFSISSASSDQEFSDILSKALNSTNRTASKLAGKIAKVGEGKDDFKKTLAQRNLVNKMNNYRAMLEDAELKDFAMQHLKELGEQMHTSFLRSLEIIAARIPAQSQQSFMAMQVESYDNPDINSAYVSIFQFYLLGSDLDIDAVSLQTFELGRNGLYVGHSPYYSLANEDMRKASDKLPFPTGVKIIEKIDKPQNTTLATLLTYGLLGRSNKGGMSSLFNIDIRNDKTIHVSINLDSPELFVKFASVLEHINEKGFVGTSDIDYWVLALIMSEKLGGLDVQFGITMVKDIVEQIKTIIDNHNLYLTKLKPKKRLQVIKNYATAQLREIIEDPINRRLADSSVDVVTKPAKALSKLSPKATVQTTFTPGNVANKFQSISENMVGKDGIAICATGLKSFFALTDVYQEILNGDDAWAKDSLLFSVPFGGKIYRGLANGYAKDYKSPYEENITEEEKLKIDQMFPYSVQEYLLDLLWASDAANEMSALLGLSTDNAKELVLAKINAGTASMGMYLYGLSIGIPFDQLYEVMTSPLAFRLTELTKGDSFNGNAGTINIIGALRYLKQEPINQMVRFNRIDLSDYQDAVKPVQFFLNLLTEQLSGIIKDSEKLQNTIEKNGGPLRTFIYYMGDATKSNLDMLRLKVSSLSKLIKDPKVFEQYQVLFNQLIDFAEQYADDVKLADNTLERDNAHGKSLLYEDLETLATGAEEMKQIGKILRLNQEIKTNSTDLIEQVNNIEEAIIRRAKQLKAQLRRLGITKNNFKGDPEIKNMIFSKNLTKDYSKGGYRINFEKFITDPSYAEEMIRLYNLIKQSYNPLQILKVAPQYKGYSESLLLAYKGLRDQSVKFRLTVDKVRDFCNTYNIVDPKLRQLVVKNTERAVDLYMRLAWMLTHLKPITLPASTKERTTFAFIDSGASTRVLNYNTEIRLGTELGDANYKLWMETQVIPKLKEMYPDNKFIQGLQPVINTATNLGSVSVNYGLHINMMPKSDYDRDLFNEYKEAFNELITVEPYRDGAGNSMTILDMFYYYSLIANNGRVGPTSLQGIFEDYVTRDDNNHPPRSYNRYISNADASEGIYNQLIGFITNEMMAPFSSPYAGGTDILRYKNKDLDRIDLYIKPEQSSSTDDNPYDDEYNPMLEQIMDYEAMMGQYHHDATAEINGYKRESGESMHLSDNRNYFLNPIAITGLADSYTINVTAEEASLYPTLSRFLITVSPVKKGRELKAGLIGIASAKVEDKPLILKFIDKIRKENKGMIATAVTINKSGIADVIAVKKWLESALSAIENNCI